MVGDDCTTDGEIVSTTLTVLVTDCAALPDESDTLYGMV